MGYSTPDTLASLAAITADNYNNKIKASIIADAFDVLELGGSRLVPIVAGGGVQDAPNPIDQQPVANSNYSGFVWKIECEVLTENAATTVTPELYNVTDASVVWTGSASTATSWGTYQIATVTLASGKRYRLRATKSNDTYEGFVIGRLLRFHA